jgi:hypothetical protein
VVEENDRAEAGYRENDRADYNDQDAHYFEERVHSALSLQPIQQRLAHPDGAGEKQQERHHQQQDAEHVGIEAVGEKREEAEAAADEAEDAADHHQDSDDLQGAGVACR